MIEQEDSFTFHTYQKTGSLKEGKPYEMKYTNSYGNVCTHFVHQPDAISKFFASSHVIDTHNQLCQDLLQLEKKWLTKSPYFPLTTTLLGINVTDTFLLANHHRIINHTTCFQYDKKIGFECFVSMLAFQLLKQLGYPQHCFMQEEVQQEPQKLFYLNGRTHYLVKSCWRSNC